MRLTRGHLKLIKVLFDVVHFVNEINQAADAPFHTQAVGITHSPLNDFIHYLVAEKMSVISTALTITIHTTTKFVCPG